MTAKEYKERKLKYDFFEAYDKYALSEKVDEKVRFYITKFFDFDNEERLEEKTVLLEEAAAGKTVDEIAGFFKLLDLYPAEGTLWD